MSDVINDLIASEDKGNYPYYQATYMQGSINLCVRGDGREAVMNDLQKMVNDWTNWVGSQGEVSSVKPVSDSKKCNKCGTEMKYKTGEKNGKVWKGYFCQNQTCKNVEWLK